MFDLYIFKLENQGSFMAVMTVLLIGMTFVLGVAIGVFSFLWFSVFWLSVLIANVADMACWAGVLTLPGHPVLLPWWKFAC